jgi:S-adenosylmethionine decarboxylase
VTRIINAKLVSVSTQDYDPRGASVVALINEEHPMMEPSHYKGGPGGSAVPLEIVPVSEEPEDSPRNEGESADGKTECSPAPAVVGHLVKTTYRYTPSRSTTSSRHRELPVNIDSPPADISPLSALHCLIESFDSESSS